MEESPEKLKEYSLWRDAEKTPRPMHSPHAQETDVVVVGAGITGLQTALELKKAGHSVTVVEAKTPGSATTGHSSAHASAVQDAGYARLATLHGQEVAGMVADQLRRALGEIESRAAHCDWRRVPAYLYAATQDDLENLRAEERALQKAGFQVEQVPAAPLPTPTLAALRIENQGLFHPLKYLAALQEELEHRGVPIVTGTRAQGIERKAGGLTVTLSSNAILAQHVVLATHYPWSLVNESEAIPYRSYLVAMEVEKPLEPGLYWDTAQPYHYVRGVTVEGQPLALIGGSDHRTGFLREKDHQAYSALEAYGRHRVGATRTRYRWSAQYYEPVDGLPFIGQDANKKRLWIATGYSGNGLAFGVAAAKLIAAAINGRPHRLLDSLRPNRRTSPITSPEFFAENARTGYRMARDRLFRAGGEQISSLGPGEGDVFRIDGELVAACRNDDGTLICRSAVCTHTGGIVEWNPHEQSWDCPIHGGRYSCKGKWIEGPPPRNLAKLDGEA